MNKPIRKRVAIAGSTGMVGRRFAELLVDHPWYEIAMLVGDKSTGESYGAVWERKEKSIRDYYGRDFWVARACPDQLKDRRVQSFDDLLKAKDIDFIFSAMPSHVWPMEHELLEMGYTLFSNSPYGRFDESNPLVVAEVNGDEIRGQRFIKNPNCVSSGLVLVLAPIRERYGLREVSVVTFQSLTGKGDAKYPRDLVVGNVYSLHDSDEQTEEYILAEVHKILREAISISVSCNRVYVQEGHLVNVKIKTVDRIKSSDEVSELLRSFNPLKNMMLPSGPVTPLAVINEAGRPRPRQDSYENKGMTVVVGGISIMDDVFDLRLQYVVNNLTRGAAGGALLNSELYMQKQCEKTAESKGISLESVKA